MKTQAEIQRAHDLLVGIILDETPIKFEPFCQSGKAIVAAADVLCWVLEHDHNQTFAGNLSALEFQIAQRGAVLIDHGN